MSGRRPLCCTKIGTASPLWLQWRFRSPDSKNYISVGNILRHLASLTSQLSLPQEMHVQKAGPMTEPQSLRFQLLSTSISQVLLARCAGNAQRVFPETTTQNYANLVLPGLPPYSLPRPQHFSELQQLDSEFRVSKVGFLSDIFQKAFLNFVVAAMAATSAVKGSSKLHTSMIRTFADLIQ